MEKIIQFGEGGFLRGFVDYFLHKMNEKGLFDGKVVVVQPIEKGMIDVLNAQNGKYNLFLRGIQDGELVNERTEISIISRAINPYEAYDSFLELALIPEMRFIFSNTTEAGIEFSDTDKMTDTPPKTFPAKLTMLLYKRFSVGLPGFGIMPCELIDNNGDELKKCVLKYAELWQLGADFTNFILNDNQFCNTLVDRIVTGFPKDEYDELVKKIGWEDKLIDTAEIFHKWVIEGDFEEELPFNKAGYNIIWTKDVKPYKKVKVRILNGAHTAMVLAAHLYGLTTVGECMKDELFYDYLKTAIYNEIIPVLGSKEDDLAFGKAVLERFANPYIKHLLLSIALNSVSKFKVRVLPTILEYRDKFNKNPKILTFSLAALIAFYKTEAANDDKDIMAFMKTSSVKDILANVDLWGQDIRFLLEEVEFYGFQIDEKGIAQAVRQLLA